MDGNSIKEAWEESIAKLPVRPQEIKGLVTRVAYELASVASNDGKPAFDEKTSSVTLPHGLTIQLEENEDPTTGLQKCEFRVYILRTGGTRIQKFMAQASFDDTPGISDPENPEDTQLWTETDGPQKGWIVNSLRKQVTDFLGANGK